jgi:putative DNA primase/helicase
MDQSTPSSSSTQAIPPRPRALPVLPEHIPNRLKNLKQFVDWGYFWNHERHIWDKPPRNARSGNLASSTNPGTWATFEQAMSAYATGRFDGIGVVVCKKNRIIVGDVDHCRNPETGEIDPEALEIVLAIGSYAEISPSGTGLRFVVEGALPGKGRKRGNIELYDNARYVTLTGHHLEGTPTTIEPRQDAINALLERVFGTSEATTEPQSPHPNGNASHIDDDDILARACAAANGKKFKGLWDGSTAGYARNGNDGRNEADLALCALIAFYTRDPEQIDRLFRRSGLMRPKWDEPRGEETYGAMTIRKALAFQRKTWQPPEFDDEMEDTSPSDGAEQDESGADVGDEQQGHENNNAQQRHQAPPYGRLIRNDRKRVISCQHNALIWLAKHGYQDRITLDTFRQSVMVDGVPLTDDVVIEMVRLMEASEMIRWAEMHVHNAIVSIATRNGRSSLKTWLDSLVWDGTQRLRTFFANTYGAEVSDYTAACADVMFISAVARAYEPGCQADVMVVLIGDQGIGKSKGIADLVPDPAWYTDDLGGDLYDRKAGEGLQGKWLIEFGEFARINRATLDVVKSFLSRRVDHFRPAYGRTAKDFPRQCIFIGTTNNPMPLQDLQNRRFMPVLCPKDVADDIGAQRDQLWAEAVHRYKAGTPWWITDQELLRTVKERQEDARQHDEWEEVLKESLIDISLITLMDVADRLDIPIERLDKSTQTRLGLAMKAIGFTRKRDTTRGPRRYYWVRDEDR